MVKLAIQEAFETPKKLHDPHCDLCQAQEKGFVFHKDHICWATINPKWNIPMVVLNDHKRIPTPDEQQHMLRVLDHIMSTYGYSSPISEGDSRGSYGYSDPQSIPDHYHVQAGRHEGLGPF